MYYIIVKLFTKRNSILKIFRLIIIYIPWSTDLYTPVHDIYVGIELLANNSYSGTSTNNILNVICFWQKIEQLPAYLISYK